MPAIRNSQLIKRFTDFFKLKTNDFLDSEAGRMLVPVITEPIPKNVVQIIDVALNDSDKTIIVPSGKQWKILYGQVAFTTTAEVGGRRISFRVRDASNNILYIVDALNAQTAGLSEQYSYGQFGEPSEGVSGRQLLPIPVNLILSEDFNIRILDSSAIDAAADDLLIRLVVEEIDVTGE